MISEIGTKARLGKRTGVVATAHKLARIIYTMIKEQLPCNKDIIGNEQEKWKAKRIKFLEKQLEQLKTEAWN